MYCSPTFTKLHSTFSSIESLYFYTIYDRHAGQKKKIMIFLSIIYFSYDFFRLWGKSGFKYESLETRFQQDLHIKTYNVQKNPNLKPNLKLKTSKNVSILY